MNTNIKGNMIPKSYLHTKDLLNDMSLSNKDVVQKMILFKVMACIFTMCRLLYIICPGLLQTPKKYALFIILISKTENGDRKKLNNLSKII